jgi:hypothetical protein
MKKQTLTFALLALLSTGAIISAAGCKKQVETPEQDQGTDRTPTTEASGEVFVTNGTWTARINGVTRYTGTDYIAAIQAACNGLTAGRTSKETITIKNSGSSGNSGGAIKAVNIPSYTILDFVGTTFNCNSNDLYMVQGLFQYDP